MADDVLTRDEIRNKVATDFLSREHFVCYRDSEELLIYRDGIYVKCARSFIKQFVDQEFNGEATISDYNEVEQKIKIRSYQDRSIFDVDRNLICVQNGILTISTSTLIPHDPQHYFTWKLPVNFNPDAKCPKFEQFVKEISKDENMILAVNMLFGYCLYRDYPIRNFFILVGDGNNGKSTLIRLLQQFLGSENTSAVSLYQLHQRFQSATLEGKLANLVADLPMQTLKNTGMLKQLCGEDPIPAEMKNNPILWHFFNYAKLIFSCNKCPEITDESDALYHRLLIFIFPNKFPDDSKYYDGLISGDEFSGILNLALKSLQDLLTASEFPNDLSIEDKRELFAVLGSDPIRGFRVEMLEPNIKWQTSMQDLYFVYVDYCKSKNLPIRDLASFAKKLRTFIDFTEDIRLMKSGKRNRAVIGIKVKGREDVGEAIPELSQSIQSQFEKGN